ncbi:hypothetical protein DL96DRAFT_1622322 [Flagelloscypha sp. PMI_526]|nr:hypothetical protein DL96DRAFT_1622322 [Flagelloscypha sp. PMI_526]
MGNPSPINKAFYRASDLGIGNDNTHRKVWCKFCVDARIIALQHAAEQEAAASSTVGLSLTHEEWIEYAKTRTVFMPSKLEIQAKHLEDCEAAKDSQKSPILAEHREWKEKSTGSRATLASGRLALLQQTTSNSSLRISPNNSLHQNSSPMDFTRSPTPFFSIPWDGTSPSPAPPSPQLDIAFSPPSPLQELRPLKRSRLSLDSQDQLFGYSNVQWNGLHQAEFNADFTRLVIASGLPYGWSEHPETRLFFAKYIPPAQVPSRHAIAGPLVQRDATRMEGMDCS